LQQPAIPAQRSVTEVVLRLVYLLLLLYGFLVAIECMSKAIKALSDTGLLGGGSSDEELFAGVSNPFAGLALGVLFTVMVQSSSTTTTTIVAVVGSGALSVEHALPMILGANIGTTITNTLVSVGHVRRAAEFRRAYAAATVHDFFNLMMVAVALPLELSTRVLSTLAGRLTEVFRGGGGAEYKSPIKAAVKTGHKAVTSAVESLGLDGRTLGVVMLIVGIALTILCLFQITKNMRRLMAGRIETAMNKALEAHALFGILLGVLITVSVQSSSITTSLLVPMCAAGVMRLRNAFPIMLGANIGTTVTALLASMAQENPAALTIALVHVLFNVTGVVVVYPIKPVRAIPLRLSQGLANAAAKNRLWVLVYVVGVFVLLPLAGWFVWKG
jgi:sodium-dependent phosphate cotransporter